MRTTVFVLCTVALAAAQYGVEQAPPVQMAQQPQVVSVPVYGQPTFNEPPYTNVARGRNHGRFFDEFLNNWSSHPHSRHSSESKSRDDSSHSSSHEHRPRPYYGYPNRYPYQLPPYYAQPPVYGYGPVYPDYISNPFYVSDRKPRRHHKKHHGRHNRHSSSSERSNDHSSDGW